MESEENEEIMKWIDRQYLETPFYGSRRMTICLRRDGYEVNRKRVMRLMRNIVVPMSRTKKRRKRDLVKNVKDRIITQKTES